MEIMLGLFWLATTIVSVKSVFARTRSKAKAWIVLILCLIMPALGWILAFMWIVTSDSESKPKAQQEMSYEEKLKISKSLMEKNKWLK